jgi:phosphate transport system protein
MGEKTQLLLHDSLDSLLNLDASEAASICNRDDEIDQMKAVIRERIEEAIKQEPEKVGSLLRVLAVSRNLERIADLATSIAEDVVYLVEGRIMRHPTLTAVRNGA